MKNTIRPGLSSFVSTSIHVCIEKDYDVNYFNFHSNTYTSIFIYGFR